MEGPKVPEANPNPRGYFVRRPDGAIKPNLPNIRSKLEDQVKEKLEGIYGVRITRNTLTLSCIIARIHFDDEGKSVEYREELLQSKAADLLEKACDALRSELDVGEDDEDEKSLDADMYKLVRSFVEFRGIGLEKDPDRDTWLYSVRQELRDSMDKWDQFVREWKPLQKKHKCSPERLVREAQLLEELRQELLSWLPKNGELHCSIDPNRWNNMIRRLDVLVTLDSDTFYKKFQQFVTVGPDLLAKVASSLTGVPASWLLRSSLMPSLDNLAARLSKRKFGKKFTILTISHALSRAVRPGPLGSASRPIGSFLFLCGHRHDGPELAEALAEELFEGKGSLIHFDLLKYTEPDSVSRLLGVPTSQADSSSSGELAEELGKNPFGVVLFSNIDVAPDSVVNMLIDVSRCGRLTSGLGRTIDFRNTLIIMTSTIGIEPDKDVSFACNCFRMVEECPIKEVLKRYPEGNNHKCTIFPRLEKVHNQLKQELLEELDDIVFFAGIRMKYCKAIARLHLREIASSLTAGGLIIYPSEAALTEILWKALWWQGGEKLIKVWLEHNLVPVLRDMCARGDIKDNHIIYIDTLVGTPELSYRLVRREDFMEKEIWMKVEKSSAELRVLRGKEKARVKRIYLLKRKLYALNPTIFVDSGTDFGCVDRAIRESVDIIQLMMNEIDANVVADKEKVVQREKVELSLGDGARKRAKKGVEFLKTRLHDGLQEKAAKFVAKAALRVIDAPHYPPRLPTVSFLFLGLTTSGKGKLAEEIDKDFVSDDGKKLLVTVDLSEYADSNSLSRLTDALSGYLVSDCGEEEVFRYDVCMRPCSVLLLHRVEKAHMSIFTALLSVLHYSMFIDHQGRTVGFRDTIVIITSDAGNKKFFARLVGHGSQNFLCDSNMNQEVKGFRCELLNVVHEMVFSNPFASPDEQLREYATLSFFADSCLNGRSTPEDLPMTLFNLFKPANYLGDDDSEGDLLEESYLEMILSDFKSWGLVVHGGSSWTAVQ